jgi:hypothetical protein
VSAFIEFINKFNRKASMDAVVSVAVFTLQRDLDEGHDVEVLS